MRYFFVEKTEITNAGAHLSGTDARHIQKVLRLKPGATIGLFDGEGFEYLARIETVSPGRVQVAILDRFAVCRESTFKITLAQALLKEKKMDTLLRPLTELGITAWMPYIADRSVPQPSQKQSQNRIERWKKITREAVKQCRRGKAVKIEPISSFAEVLAMGGNFETRVIFYEQAGTTLKDNLVGVKEQAGSVLALLGPEGGFTKDEVTAAKAAGFIVAGLGPRILRAETAALSACVLLQHMFGDMQ
jgi:16S rRNA (uracil1498-N3)-methyltransferase